MKKDKQKVYKDRTKYETMQQTQAYRQQAQKESHILQAKTKADIEKLDPFFNLNNNYLGVFKNDQGRMDNSSSVAYQHPLDQLGRVEYEYNQKLKKDRSFIPNRDATQKDLYTFPVTSSAEYGWRQPIDDPKWGYGAKSTFQIFEKSFRGQDKPKEEKKK